MMWLARNCAYKLASRAALIACLAIVAPARAAAPDVITMDIGDEPGRVSTAEVKIEDGPFARQLVFFRTTEAPGRLVINTQERFLYLVQGNNRALRYGIGVGREGFQWSGLVKIARKAEWPDWTPPPEMIERQPYLPRFMAGRPGQPDGRPRDVSRRDGLSHPRHQPAGDDRSGGVFRLLPPRQRRRDRPLFARRGRGEGHHPPGYAALRGPHEGRHFPSLAGFLALAAALVGAGAAGAARSSRSRQRGSVVCGISRDSGVSPSRILAASGSASMSTSAARLRPRCLPIRRR